MSLDGEAKRSGRRAATGRRTGAKSARPPQPSRLRRPQWVAAFATGATVVLAATVVVQSCGPEAREPVGQHEGTRPPSFRLALPKSLDDGRYRATEVNGPAPDATLWNAMSGLVHGRVPLLETYRPSPSARAEGERLLTVEGLSGSIAHEQAALDHFLTQTDGRSGRRSLQDSDTVTPADGEPLTCQVVEVSTRHDERHLETACAWSDDSMVVQVTLSYAPAVHEGGQRVDLSAYAEQVSSVREEIAHEPTGR